MGRRAMSVRLRVDARRPASWLTFLAGAAAAWLLPPADAVPAAAILGGGLVAAAALGGLPQDATAAAWAASRVAWPMVGLMVGWLAGGCGLGGSAVASVAACGATATAIAAASRSGLPPAVATGIGLALAAVAALAACGGGLAPHGQVPAWPLAAAGGWAVAASLAALVARARRSEPWVGALLGGAVPPALMASALAAMVVCLFLVPQVSWGYAAVAAGWLLGSGLPQAALGPGAADEGSRRSLVATTASRRPQSFVIAARILVAQAAVLVWPPLVAAALAGAAGAAGPLAIAASIAAGAGGLAIVSAASLAVGWSRDTTLALAMCATLAVGACGRFGSERGESPPRTDVEQTG